MRMGAFLVQFASMLVAAGVTGCGHDEGTPGSDEGGSSDGGSVDDVSEDLGPCTPDPVEYDDAALPCDSSCCYSLPRPTTVVTSDVACAIVAWQSGKGDGAACQQVCPGDCCFTNACVPPQGYLQAFAMQNPPSGPPNQLIVCPQLSCGITITCGTSCVGGRRTDGLIAPYRELRSEGERLAAMAWLEAVSVHAFERLERELSAHGAPPSLLRGARRARRDEVRHTAMTARLARRRGARPKVPDAPAPGPVRTLFDVALENAAEGCVRETWGALAGLVEAMTSRAPDLRRAMRSIGADEAFHASSAWAVHAWAMPRLSASERRRVHQAMRDAIAELRGGRNDHATSVEEPVDLAQVLRAATGGLPTPSQQL
jgi:hypothetical protein